MPLPVLNFLYPSKKLHDKPPDLSYLKVLRSLCYVSTSATGRSKFDPRTSKCIFLEYPACQKGYKVLNMDTNQVFISRDLSVHEQHFPFHFKNLKYSVEAPPSFFLLFAQKLGLFIILSYLMSIRVMI